MVEIIRKATLVLEHFLGRYHEGPELPARFADEVLLFVSMNPGATREEWRAFAHAFARSAWQQAYLRGVEWRERREAGEPEEEVEEEPSILDDARRAELEEAILEDPLAAGLPDAVEALDHEGEAGGGFRVVVVKGGA